MTDQTLPANLEEFSAVDLYVAGKIASIVDQIKEIALALVPDTSTKVGRDDIKSLAYKIARAKTYLDNEGKELNAEKRAQIKAVDELRAAMREELDELKKQVRAPLDEWEAEQERIDTERRERLARIESPAWPEDPVLIRGQVEAFKMSELTEEDFGPYLERARGSLVHAVRVGEDLIREAEEREERERQAEKDRAELEELRRKTEALEAEKREREEKERAKQNAAEERKRKREAAKAQKEREERIAREAAERATREAEERARLAEEQRVAEEERKAAEERQRARQAENVARVEAEILAALFSVIDDEKTSNAVLELIKNGQVPNVSINY